MSISEQAQKARVLSLIGLALTTGTQQLGLPGHQATFGGPEAHGSPIGTPAVFQSMLSASSPSTQS